MSQQGILQPVDCNIDHSPVRKRARLDEPTSSESKSSLWSLSTREVVLHEIYDHGIGRLDCDTEDLEEQDTIFSRGLEIDVSCVSMTPDSRGKQLSILESALTKESLDKLSAGEWDNMLITKPLVKITDRTNYFDHLSDEIILNIFKWLPKASLYDIALCCKRFHQLFQDESLWTRMDVSNRILLSGKLGNILSKQVIVLRLSKSEILHTPILPGCKAYHPDFRSRLLYLDLSMVHISCENLVIIFNKCRKLKKLSLENVAVNDEVLGALAGNKDIEVINFAMSMGIKEEGLKVLLTSCKKIRELNIAWTYLNANCIEYISENLSPTMDRLNFSGCRKLLLDSHVTSLVTNCPKIRELDLSDCTAITGESVKQMTRLETLTFLSLSRCYNVPYKSLSVLRRLYNLSYLDIHGGYIDGNELKEVQTVLGRAVQINQFKFSSVARPTVGLRRSSIWNMRVKD